MTRCRFGLWAFATGLLLLAGTAAPALAVKVTFHHRAPQARSVDLAGSFNGWSDSATPMADPDGDGVWTVTQDLPPGRHEYKFVVDGQWVHDPNNPQTTDDGFGGSNSVLVVPQDGGPMDVGLPGAAGAGGAAGAAEAGAANPPAATGAGDGKVAVTFAYAPGRQVSGVYLAGTFNDWNAQGESMTDPDGDGTYTVTVPLAPGRYQYKFVADGQWYQDPRNPEGTDDGFGGQNSVLVVPQGVTALDAASAPAGAGTGGTGGGSDASGGAPVTGEATGMRSVDFHYTPVISGVQDVFLAGTFNDWNASGMRMTDADGDGTYTTSILLQPGVYQYKFVVAGKWFQDPENPEGTDDGFGGKNSVLHVDASFPQVAIARGDGQIYTDDLEPEFSYATCNPLSAKDILLTARAHLDDVEGIDVVYQINDGRMREQAMEPAQSDPAYVYYRARLELDDPRDTLDYVFRYRDGEAVAYMGQEGVLAELPDQPFRYRASNHPPFLTPEWAKGAVIYQIFPERFRNGDPDNDPDFSEPWYAGVTELPASGKTNGEYFHLVKDWYDVSGLTVSPYRTDGKPDYYSFYGGDIAGVRQKLDYLSNLGVSVIYFNPLNQGMSNHKYDPVDYLKIDPHFATDEEFKGFVADCHDHGIRVIVDMAFNHTGNWHFAFRDAVEKGRDSDYWNWYEFHRWPLPDTRDFKASDYYDCWWGFGLHPNLNYDLSRPNADENDIQDAADAEVNWPLVRYVLSVADHWLGDLDIDGFRLDVPNEVPFWFWGMFKARCDSIKPDVYLVGELWGNASRWVGPDVFDATMNYKYFRDPVMDFFGKGQLDAAAFDRQLAPGRFQYPPQAVSVMMNLIDSHDTARFLTATGSVQRLMLAALFGMNYVGMPHIWYGDEVGMLGGKDPDCRRPFDWRYEGDPRKVALRDYYGTITSYRRDSEVLRHGDFHTLLTDGMVYGIARVQDDKAVLSFYNAGQLEATVELPAGAVRELLADGASLSFTTVVGPESFAPGAAAAGDLAAGRTLDMSGESVSIILPALSGVMMAN